MKPLDKDQVPKVIALGVLTTGLLGYAAYSWLGGGGGGAPAVAATPHPAPPAPEPVVGPQSTIPALQLAEIYHEDPFKPAFDAMTNAPPPPKPPAPPKPEVKPPSNGPLGDTFNGPPMDALPLVKVTEIENAAAGRVGPPVPEAPASKPNPPAAAKPAPPAPPSPPAVVVTGILEGDDNVAILKWNDSHRQVVRVGDRMDGGFVVKAIRSDAVVVAHRSTQWTIRLGADKPVAN